MSVNFKTNGVDQDDFFVRKTEVATATEINTGTNNTSYVTPLAFAEAARSMVSAKLNLNQNGAVYWIDANGVAHK